MLGYENEELDGDPDRWLTMIHPDDREVVAAADRAHLAGETEFFEAEFRMRHKQGHWLWILDRGKVIERDEAGNMARAIGSLTDITRRKEAEERLASSAALLADEKERLRVTLQSIGDAVICSAADGRISFMNPVAEKLTGIAGGEALGLPLDRVYCAVDEETGQRLDMASLFGAGHGRVEQNSRAVLVRADRTRCSIRQVVSRIVNEGGEFGGLVIVFQDFTDARALQRQLAYAATHDALTGLSNRSSFLRAMEDMLAAMRAGAASRQFMFIDLDHFKAVNDTGGHAAGDALLKQVAETIRDALAPGDVLARLGGDEFAVVLNSMSASDAEVAASAIIESVRMLEFEWSGEVHRIGASIGLAPFGPDCGEVDEIIARADAACYAAKAAGRGCAVPLPASAAPQPPIRSVAAGR
jgi:diguanylate cyclase (GGDEF)-like protein/PAS domain S-box-containing protein